MLTSDQIRAVRALLRWSGRELAEKAGVHPTTVQRMERGDGPVGGTVQTLAKVERALEQAGVAFTTQNGPGVRLKKRRRASDRRHGYRYTTFVKLARSLDFRQGPPHRTPLPLWAFHHFLPCVNGLGCWSRFAP